MSEITKLAPALVEAQAELKDPAMLGDNPHFRSKFATLKAIKDAVMPVFNKHGLAVIQRPVPQEAGIGIQTVIIHKSGETLDVGTIAIPVTKQDAQAYMSAVTYARRYGMQTAAGVCGDPDDDGAEGKDKEPVTPTVPQKPVAPNTQPRGTKPAETSPKQDEATGKAQAAPKITAGDIKWRDMMQACKRGMGEESYRAILNDHGFAKSTDIKDKAERKVVYNQMTTQIKANADKGLE